MAKETKKPGVAPETNQAATHDWSQTGVTGMENVTQEDLGIPFLTILQKGNPQVDKDHKDYATKKIDDAEVGDIMNTVANAVVCKCGDELDFVPCTFQKLFMEWTPREKGGGIVKAHTDASILNECQRNEKGQDVLRSGNIVVTTAYFYGIMLQDGQRVPCIIGLSSTQLKKSKQWLNMITTLKLISPSGQRYTPPMFSHTYKLSTATEHNEKGSWRGWVIKTGPMVTDAVLIADSMAYAKRATQVRAQLNAPPAEPSAAEAHI